MSATALLFDLDGTLWDSWPWFARILSSLTGDDPARLEQRLASGTSIVRLTDECGVTQSRFAREAGTTSETLPLYDGALRTLDALATREVPMAVVSNLPGRLVAPMTDRAALADYFETVVTPRPFDGIRAKPAAQGIHAALRAMSLPAAPDIWFVGDGTVDARAAQSAGLSFAWASYGYEPEKPACTERVLTRLSDLLEL